MTYNPIFLTALTLGEKAALSGEMLLRGMGTVFLVLVILWGIIAAIGKVFSSSSNKSASKAEKKPTAPAPKTESANAPEVKPSAPVAPAAPSVPASDDALVAAICAAIEAYRAEEGLSGLPYRVVSFKRRSGKKSWTGNSED